MTGKTFLQMSDSEIWQDLLDTEMKALGQKRLMHAIARVDRNWCCDAIRKSSGRIKLKDGTLLRMHFCPRCGGQL